MANTDANETAVFSDEELDYLYIGNYIFNSRAGTGQQDRPK